MVPFGSAAFFPGRLIHTNEPLVLIGEGYYAERTARQTVEILERRGMGLEAQVETLKGMVLDLEAEARFFETTAVEGAEGRVEIREEYIGEPQNIRGDFYISCRGDGSDCCNQSHEAIIGDSTFMKFEKTRCSLQDSLKRVEDIVPEDIGARHQLLVCLKPASPDSCDYLFTGSRGGTLRRRALADGEAICSVTFESHVD